jgi:hypothetical protein
MELLPSRDPSAVTFSDCAWLAAGETKCSHLRYAGSPPVAAAKNRRCKTSVIGPRAPRPDGPAIESANRRHLGRSAGKESLVGSNQSEGEEEVFICIIKFSVLSNPTRLWFGC